jgi:4'-phosphopantetheinyl transferase EntD
MMAVTSTFLETWKTLLPPGIKVSGGALVRDAPALTSRERASVGAITSERQREFQSGRACAKRALSLYGVLDIDLPVGSDRSPIWPAGFIGSITHVRKNSEGFCAAAVARSDHFLALGIDVEYGAGLAAGVWPTILATSELDQIRKLPINEREVEVIRRWCAKEAMAKAARRSIDPLAVETQNSNADRNLYSLTERSGRAQGWHARVACWGNLVLAGVAVPAQ